MKEHQLPPALRKPVKPPTPTVPATSAPASAAPSQDTTPAPPKWQPIPTLKALGLKPLNSTPPTTSAPLAPKLTKTTLPISKPNPRIANLEGRISLLEGTFTIDGGEPFSVETPLTGDGPRDKQALVALARWLHPNKAVKLASTRIFSRETGAQATYPPGATFGGLFGGAGSPTENAVEVGEVFFQGEKCLVIVRNLRSRDAVTLALRPPGGGQIVFSNRIASNTPAHTLAIVIREILGNDARELKVTIRCAV